MQKSKKTNPMDMDKREWFCLAIIMLVPLMLGIYIGVAIVNEINRDVKTLDKVVCINRHLQQYDKNYASLITTCMKDIETSRKDLRHQIMGL